MRRLALFVSLICLAGVASAQVTEAWTSRKPAPSSGHNTLIATERHVAQSETITTLSRADMLDGSVKFYLQRFNRNGVLLWSKVQGHSQGGRAIPVDMKLDGDNNVFVLADLRPGTEGDVALYKYDDDGNLLWRQIIADKWLDAQWKVHEADEHAVELGVTETGTAYVLSNQEGDPALGKFAVTTRFAPNGTIDWTKDYVRAGAGSYAPPRNWPKSLKLNAAGNPVILVLTSGIDAEDVPTLDDMTVVSYDDLGNMVGDPSFNSFITIGDAVQYLEDLPIAMELDASGNAAVVGTSIVYFNRNGNLYPVNAQSVVQFTPTGVSWSRITLHQDEFNRPGQYNPTSVMPIGGDIVVGGSVRPYSLIANAYVERHNAGAMAWAFNGARGRVNSLAQDSQGNIYVAAKRVHETATKTRYFAEAHQLSGTGGLIWTNSEIILDNQMTEATTLNINGAGDVYVGSTLVKNTGGTPQAVSNLTKLLADPKIISIEATPSAVSGGSSFQVKVTIDKDAFGAGYAVNITSNRSAVNVPAGMVIPAGDDEATFTFTTDAVNQDTTVTLSGQPGNTPTETVVVKTAWVDSFTLSTNNVLGGDQLTGTVVLSSPAAAGGATVVLDADSSNVILPQNSTVKVAAGTTTRVFTIRTRTVSSNESPFISATYSSTARAQLNIFAVEITSFTAPVDVLGSRQVMGTVTLNAPAPTGGMPVQIVSDNVAIPSGTIVVPKGQTSFDYVLASEPVAVDTPVKLIAKTPTASFESTVQVLAPKLTSAVLGTSTVTSGGKTTLTLRVNGPAPAGGLTIALSSSNSNVATVLSTAVIPGGKNAVSVTVKANTVTSTQQATITATSNSTSKSAVLTVTP